MRRPRVRAPEQQERLRDFRQEHLRENANELMRRLRGIQERPEQIKNGRDSLACQLLAHRSDHLEGRMILRREQKSHARLLDASAQNVRRQIDPDTELLQHIRAAAARGDAAVPVLHHRRAARREDENAGRRDIEKIHAVAARPAHIEHRPREARRIDLRIDRPPEKRPHERRDLLRRLPFFAQRAQKRCLPAVVRPLVEQRLRSRGSLLRLELAAGAGMGGEIGERMHWPGSNWKSKRLQLRRRSRFRRGGGLA